ncbi:alpha/beta hydrolase family protein [Glycomyces sp. TRM65418]|uniref:alpha/beta hydrolase n=1 Tax=Glycomyces sp. TRM65418 TaxID=2867006 RepID=UPI001CE5FD9D|nr:alpha/beta hydrolase [Glycomyces sp. TRM65418]MCC3764084.1 alpha/beta hydrolase family protein [Glycomyces sp. TRM65418]QZD53774.1 alpha/beta hydrolase family protein [Glycomyces sp. TRM65418]
MGTSLTWEDLSLADLEPLSRLAASWASHTSAMLEAAERVTGDIVGDTLSADHFDSDTADECRAQLGRLADQFVDDLHDYASVRIGATIDELYQTLSAQQENLKDLIDEVVAGKFVIQGSAGSEYVELTQRLEDELNAEADPISAVADARTGARLLQSRLREIMERARTADEDAASVLGSLGSEAVDLPPFLGSGYSDAVEAYETALAEHEAAQREEMLGGGADPHAVAGWWASLSESEREALISDERDAIRNLDGIPSAVRHDANMDYLVEYVEANPHDEYAQSLLDRVRGNPATAHDDLMLLGLHAPHPDGPSYGAAPRTGDDWGVIVATGDPDRADNVGVYVPGTGSDTAWDVANFKDGTGTYITFAENIQAAADDASGGAENVTVMWLGADMPDTLPDAASSNYAQRGAALLDSFTTGVNATNGNGSDVNITQIGHSYGGTMTAYADAHGGRNAADGVVLVGAPGPGTDNPSAGAFNVGGDNVHVMQSPNDEIRFATATHGPAPLSEAFGGNEAEGGEGNHMSYFHSGSAGVDTLGEIMTDD